MNASPRFGEIAAQLVENGYEPLPLHWGQKRPIPDTWQCYTFRQGDAKLYAQAGVGILTGKVIGVDIDVRDEALAQQIEALADAMLGQSSPRRIGQAPKVLRLLQAEEPFAKITTRGYRLAGDEPDAKSHRVEILAQGQQAVCFNRHPDTGRPYEWNGAGDPVTVPIGMLPVMSERQARAFIAAAEQLLARCGTPVGRLVEADDQRHQPNEEQRASDVALLRQALAAIPNDDLEFDSWLRVLYAAKGALGENGLKDFLAWSAKSSKDVATFSTREFLAAKPKQIGAGTIYHLAATFGWRRPALRHEEEIWPDPVNLFAELAAPAFTTCELPEELGTYGELYAEQTGIDPTIMLTAAAGAAAAAIPDQIQVCASSSSNWFAQPRLWILVIAAPGAGKSPGQREMMAPLWKLHTELDAAWRRSLTEDEPDPPRPRVVVADTTLEALSDVLADNPRGVIVGTDEFDSWLGAMDQYRTSAGPGRDRGEWLRLFDGGPHSVERIKRGSVFVPNWGCSILTASTPVAMARLTRYLPEDGLLQRFVVAIARRQRITDAPPRAEIAAERVRYSETLNRLWRLAPRAHNGAVPLSLQAVERFNAWRAENMLLQETLGSLEPALEGHIAKYPTLALRLALTFHCARIVNLANERARDPAAYPIPVDTLETALRFLKRASQHALAVYVGRKGGSHAFDLARQVARFVVSRAAEETSHGLQRRDLVQRVRAFRDAEVNLQRDALRLLEDFGWLRSSDDGYRKEQPTRFAVSPKLAARFAAQAERERERRRTARELITEAAAYRRVDGQEGG